MMCTLKAMSVWGHLSQRTSWCCSSCGTSVLKRDWLCIQM